MPLSSYAELQASIIATLNRTDLASVVPDWIALAEGGFNRHLSHWRQNERATATITGRYTDLPANWLSTLRVSLTTGPTTALRLTSWQEMQELRAGNADATGTPSHYAHTQGQLEVWPSPSGTFTADLVYREKVPSLSDTQTTNWVLINYPDLYLYGALLHSAPYLHEDARLATWDAIYRKAVDEVNTSSAADEWSGTGKRVVGRRMS